MPKLQIPIFLAREHRDADELVEQLYEARVDAEICEVIVGANQPGWHVLVSAGNADRARSIATVLEVQRYGDWESRRSDESHWGVIEDDSALRDPTEVYSAQSVVQAHLLKNLLAEQGIMAVVANQLLHGGSGIDLVGTPTAAKVMVAAEDAVAAREFALEFDERSQEPGAWPGGEIGDEEGPPWPVCPGCGAKRTTRCPICKTSGTDFTEADRGFLGELAVAAEEAPSGGACGCSGSCSPQPGGQPHKSCASAESPADQPHPETETMLMCCVCDEPFEPAYPKQCEWCGYEFDDGYMIDRIVAPEQIPGRVIAVVASLGILALVGLVYFLVILR